MALLGKWVWRFAIEKDNLWKKVLLVKYGQEGFGWRTNEVRGTYGVGVWKEILKEACWVSSEEDSVFWKGGGSGIFGGSVQIKDFSGRRKFVQTFFLAPQEKGFFVLNDILHFIDEDLIQQHPAALLAQSSLDSRLNASNTIPEPVSNYMLGGEIQAREFVAPVNAMENGPVDRYSFPEQRLQQVTETEIIPEDNSGEDSNGSLQNVMNTLQDLPPAPVDEPVGEPQKHTYASILRVAKGQSVPSVSPQLYNNKSMPPASEWHHMPQPSNEQSVASSVMFEKPASEVAEEVSGVEDEGEIKSVYVRNLPSTVSASEIAKEFKNFGRVKPDGVVIRNRKDNIGVCYAFVEYEDISGVQNAIKASTVQIAGRQVHIEERRANSNNLSRGGRRGRGRGSYQSEAPRGRYGARTFGRGNGQDGGDRDYNRPRGNGFYRPSARQDRGFSGNQQQQKSVGFAGYQFISWRFSQNHQRPFGVDPRAFSKLIQQNFKGEKAEAVDATLASRRAEVSPLVDKLGGAPS
uniref:G3BP-like protein n=1 Tax=Vitis vinifera TaxID=29760 RepID=A5BDH3_VITVI|nr:hypothetical protein VITISV_026572 [Vitis vinifera]